MMIRRLVLLGAFAAIVFAQIPMPAHICNEPLWVVGTVEIVCDGPYVFTMRGGFPWNGSYQPVGSPFSGDYGATISVVGMADGRDDPPFSKPSPVGFTVVRHEPAFDDVWCDANGDGRIALDDISHCLSHMTGPAAEENEQ